MAGSNDKISLARTTAVTKLDENTYSATFSSAYSVGSVPNGGYVTTCLLNVASAYFENSELQHPLNVHIEFLKRTESGPAIFIVKQAKKGQTAATIHVTIFQHNLLDHPPYVSSNSRSEVAAYITHSNLAITRGPTIVPPSNIQPDLPPVDFAKLGSNRDPNWARTEIRISLPTHLPEQIDIFTPRDNDILQGSSNQWCRLARGEKFTTSSLAFPCDMFPSILEAFRQAAKADVSPQGVLSFPETIWYPTLVMNIQFKRSLPKQGITWVRSQVSTKEISEGQYDTEVIIWDTEGKVLAISHHVSLIVDGAKNMGDRNRDTEPKNKI